MKSGNVDLKMITEQLREQCPFIMFAIITGLGEEYLSKQENPGLSVYIGSDTGTWDALEHILPVVESTVPEGSFEVTLLNRVDVITRYKAVHGQCLFIRQEMEQKYFHFVKNARLDYRIMRAKGRRLGLIDND